MVFLTQQQIRHIIPAGDIPLPVDPVSNHLVFQSFTPKTPRKSQQHGHKKDIHSSDLVLATQVLGTRATGTPADVGTNLTLRKYWGLD